MRRLFLLGISQGRAKTCDRELRLPADEDDHRRALAVLTYLRE
jgi:hypothetical protein